MALDGGGGGGVVKLAVLELRYDAKWDPVLFKYLKIRKELWKMYFI